MRIFILEDMMDVRKGILLKDFPNDVEIVHAIDYDAAVVALVEDNFDTFMFDHDLGFQGLNVADENTKTGTDVARFVRDRGIGKNKMFIFHSTNPAGVDNMAAALNCDGRTLVKAPINLIRRMPNMTYWGLITGQGGP